jgi:hypothetical protein
MPRVYALQTDYYSNRANRNNAIVWRDGLQKSMDPWPWTDGPQAHKLPLLEIVIARMFALACPTSQLLQLCLGVKAIWWLDLHSLS